MRLDRVDRLLHEGIVVAARVDEGEDDAGQVRQCRLLKHLQAELVGEAPGLLAAEVEERQHQVDGQVVVKELVARQSRQLPRHGELADRRRAVEKEELHAPILPGGRAPGRGSQ